MAEGTRLTKPEIAPARPLTAQARQLLRCPAALHSFIPSFIHPFIHSWNTCWLKSYYETCQGPGGGAQAPAPPSESSWFLLGRWSSMTVVSRVGGCRKSPRGPWPGPGGAGSAGDGRPLRIGRRTTSPPWSGSGLRSSKADRSPRHPLSPLPLTTPKVPPSPLALINFIRAEQQETRRGREKGEKTIFNI